MKKAKMPKWLSMCALLALAFPCTARSQDAASTACAAYSSAIATSIPNTPAVVPDQLLVDSSAAIPCLVSVVKRIGASTPAEGLSQENAARLLSATAALRSLMTKGATPADPIGANSPLLTDFITKFRNVDDIDVAAALSYAARNDTRDLRLNAVLIFSNIIDNSTVCVPLAHLNDPTLATTPNGINGRANLLGVVSVVAPWAYRENYESIARTIQLIKSTIPEGDPNFRTTSGVLANIAARLNSQKPTSNQSVSMDAGWRAACGKYIRMFAPGLPPNSALEPFLATSP